MGREIPLGYCHGIVVSVRDSCYRRTYKDLGDSNPGIKVEACVLYYSKLYAIFEHIAFITFDKT